MSKSKPIFVNSPKILDNLSNRIYTFLLFRVLNNINQALNLFDIAERIRSETRVAGAERAARSTIRDRRARSLHRLVGLRGFQVEAHVVNTTLPFSSKYMMKFREG